MRDYDPTTGRYLQADPLGLVDGASVYGYAGQNPMTNVDPRGLQIVVPQDPAAAKRSSDPIQCQAGWDNCGQMWEEEQTNCQRRFGAMIITDRKACFDRARDRFNLCISGVPEPLWPREWSDGDEDVPQPTQRFENPGVQGPGFWGAVGTAGIIFLGTLAYVFGSTF